MIQLTLLGVMTIGFLPAFQLGVIGSEASHDVVTKERVEQALDAVKSAAAADREAGGTARGVLGAGKDRLKQAAKALKQGDEATAKSLMHETAQELAGAYKTTLRRALIGRLAREVNVSRVGGGYMSADYLLYALRGFGPFAVSPIGSLLQDPDWDSLGSAAMVLGRCPIADALLRVDDVAATKYLLADLERRPLVKDRSLETESLLQCNASFGYLSLGIHEWFDKHCASGAQQACEASELVKQQRCRWQALMRGDSFLRESQILDCTASARPSKP